MTSGAAIVMPVNERTPPTKATTTPSGETSPSRMPAASATAPRANRMPATACLPRRAPTSSVARGTEPDTACSGVTARTRREPIHAASHVVSATITAGSSIDGVTGATCTPSSPRRTIAICAPAAETTMPSTVPIVAPRTPTIRPWEATRARCDLADAPIRRSRAIWRDRPATTVANVLAVTMPAT